ncbi:MAG: hypothetical protein IPK62_10190 [Bacteroidetes bacterium]|nr:hypothetical protein [Bacteroidota bacterium]
MKIQQIKIALFAALLANVFFMVSCNRIKTKDNNNDNDTEMSKDNSMAEFSYNDAMNIADEASNVNSGDNLGNYKTASNCATVTKDTTTNPRTITVDFGASNCLCNDGRYRRGKVLVTYTGKYRDAGSVHTIGFDNYFVNDNQILGSKTVTNMGLNASNQSYFNIVVNGKIIKANTTDSIMWSSNRTRTWIQGEATQTWTDDIYEITGNGSGQNKNGSFTMSIIQPLVRDLSCKWFKSGKVELQPAGKLLRTIDYGNGNCDNTATVLINGNTYSIVLN